MLRFGSECNGENLRISENDSKSMWTSRSSGSDLGVEGKELNCAISATLSPSSAKLIETSKSRTYLT